MIVSLALVSLLTYFEER